MEQDDILMQQAVNFLNEIDRAVNEKRLTRDAADKLLFQMGDYYLENDEEYTYPEDDE